MASKHRKCSGNNEKLEQALPVGLEIWENNGADAFVTGGERMGNMRGNTRERHYHVLRSIMKGKWASMLIRPFPGSPLANNKASIRKLESAWYTWKMEISSIPETRFAIIINGKIGKASESRGGIDETKTVESGVNSEESTTNQRR